MEEGTLESCTCSFCVACCRHKPGWMKPKQFREIAAYLNMDLKEAFEKYFMIDWWENYKEPGRRGYMIQPAIVGHEGKYAPGVPTGTCIFLDKDERCMIHPVKPIECAMALHDEHRFKEKEKRKIVDQWQGKAAQKMIRDVFGEPHAPRLSVLEAMLCGLGGLG